MTREEISRNTKCRLAESLKKAMAEKPFDKITVTELITDACVSRPTFYYHFNDLYELLEWMFQEELLTPLEDMDDFSDWDTEILQILRYIEENRKICQCAYNSVGWDALQNLLRKRADGIMGHYVDSLLQDIPACPEHIQFISEFYTTAVVGTVIRWMNTPRGRTPEDIVHLLHITAGDAVTAALQRSAASRVQTVRI